METQTEQVMECAIKYLQTASQHYGKTFKNIEFRFDLIGTNGAQVEYKKRHWIVRFNPRYMISHMPEILAYTVPHEIAHIVAVTVYGKIRPHGPEWRHVMIHVFGVDAHVTHDYTYPYACNCMVHNLEEHTHNQIQSGKKLFECKHCGQPIQPVFTDAIAC